MSDALGAVAEAVGSRNSQKAAQAALGVDRAGLDLQLRYRPSVEIDLARLQPVPPVKEIFDSEGMLD